MDCTNCDKKDCVFRNCPPLDSKEFADWAMQQVEKSAYLAEKIMAVLSSYLPNVAHYALVKIRELARQNKLGHQDLLMDIVNASNYAKQFYAERQAVLEALQKNDLAVVVDFLDKNPDEFGILVFFAEKLNPLAAQALKEFVSQV